MRLAQLQLIAYGPFRGLDLDLSAPGVHVVFGRNEAGKSTTLRAITGLLYGIDTRTLDAHVHKPAELRIGGTLLGDDGARIRVVRRKGVSKGGPNTLLDERGQAIDEAVLQKLLRGVSEETFRHAFGLDHDTLQLGAKALLDGRGDIGGSLFDASVGGGGDARRLLAQLTEEADRLYKPRASAPALNAALKELAEAQKSIKEQQSDPSAFVRQEKEIEESRARRDELALRRTELATRKAQIVRARHRVPLERRRAQVAAAFAAFGEVTRHAARITSLHARLDSYEGATKAHREGSLASEVFRDRVAETARRAGVAPSAKELRLDVRTQNRIQKLVGERTTLAKQLETSRVESTRIEHELSRYRAELQAPTSVDAVHVAALERAVAAVRKLGDLTARHATEAGRAARRRTDVEAKAAALGLFEGAVEALVALRLPAPATLEEVAARAAELERAMARQADAAAALESQALAVEQQLAQASGAFAPPGAPELQASRAARDEAWSALRDARTGSPSPDASTLARLDSAFERAVRDADVIADRMIVEADRVTTLARLRAQHTTLAQQRAGADGERAKVLAERAALDDEHDRLWADAGLAPRPRERAGRRLGLAEMRTWLTKHAQVVEAFAALREAELDAQDTSRVIAGAHDELAAALAPIEASAAGAARAPRTLAELLDAATPRLESIDAARRAAVEAARSIAKLEVQLDERKTAAQRDEAALADARTRLGELVAPLGIAADADGEEILRALDTLRDLFALEDQRAETESRARAAGAEARSFEEEAARAAVELAPDLTGLPAREIVAELAARSKKAHAAEEQLAGIDGQLTELEDDLVAEDIRALVADPDVAQRAVEELDAELGEVDREHTKQAQSLGSSEAGLAQMRRDSGAAEKALEAQEALARVRAVVERYARAKVGAFILGREIERYRQENLGPMLTKASELFARLTLGRYTGVRAGYNDKDKPALKCVREGNVDVDVDGLSEGTRDQLYLSLRLASLLRYADLAEPMPLVLDDVLIQFDDERSRAALEIIAELSTRMQVLFFTHHARLVDLARAAVPASSLTVHELTSAPAFALTASPPA